VAQNGLCCAYNLCPGTLKQSTDVCWSFRQNVMPSDHFRHCDSCASRSTMGHGYVIPYMFLRWCNKTADVPDYGRLDHNDVRGMVTYRCMWTTC